jgi:hypothetical protein
MFFRSKKEQDEKLLSEDKVDKELKIFQDEVKTLGEKIKKLKKEIVFHSNSVVTLSDLSVWSPFPQPEVEQKWLEESLHKDLPALLKELKSLFGSLKLLTENKYYNHPNIIEEIANCNKIIKELKKALVDNNNSLIQREKKEVGLDEYEGYGEMNSYEIQIAIPPFISLIRDYENQQQCEPSIVPSLTINRA